MKFSTRRDIEVPAEKLFAAISDFPRLERLLLRRGVAVTRIDPAQEPGTGIGWRVGFDWRGRQRDLRLDVTRFDRPERLSIGGTSDAFDMAIDMTVVALSRQKSRLIFEVNLRPKTMKSRLMLQTAKLGKAQLDRRFDKKIGEFVKEVAAAA